MEYYSGLLLEFESVERMSQHVGYIEAVFATSVLSLAVHTIKNSANR